MKLPLLAFCVILLSGFSVPCLGARSPSKCTYSYFKFNRWTNSTQIGKPLTLKSPGLDSCFKACLKTPGCNTFTVTLNDGNKPNCWKYKETYDQTKPDSQNPQWDRDRIGWTTFATYIWPNNGPSGAGTAGGTYCWSVV